MYQEKQYINLGGIEGEEREKVNMKVMQDRKGGGGGASRSLTSETKGYRNDVRHVHKERKT
jgi:hypothetical protein